MIDELTSRVNNDDHEIALILFFGARRRCEPKHNTVIPSVISFLNWNFIVQGTVSDLKTSLFGSPSEHQSAVPAIKGEQRRARTSPWEFREASTTQLSTTIHIHDLIDLWMSLFGEGLTRKFCESLGSLLILYSNRKSSRVFTNLRITWLRKESALELLFGNVIKS